jgi:hypothetical protein
MMQKKLPLKNETLLKKYNSAKEIGIAKLKHSFSFSL